MTICNSCRYCEGLCAVIPAMEKRLTFAAADLGYLANLCHQCGACEAACQFSPPHPFNVHVPSALSRVRTESYAEYAWPPVTARLFRKNAVAVSLLTALSVALFLFGFATTEHTRSAPAPADDAGLFYNRCPTTSWCCCLAARYSTRRWRYFSAHVASGATSVRRRSRAPVSTQSCRRCTMRPDCAISMGWRRFRMPFHGRPRARP